MASARPQAGAVIDEQALVFDCGGAALVGVLSLPAGGRPPVGVVVVVGGPQTRVGSHRQFVHLGRTVAAAGHAALRFDYRGMGDSPGAPGHFERVDDDIAAAIAALQRACPSVRQVVLWGLCDGASAALMYCQARRDSRVAGLALANPWVRSEAGLARTQVKHYYLRRLRDPAFWRKLLAGGVARSAFGELRTAIAKSRQRAPADTRATPAEVPKDFLTRMALGWQGFPGRILLVLSGDDLVAREFAEVLTHQPVWRAALARPGLTRHDLPEADHTFSDTAQRRRVEALTCDWLGTL